MASNQQSQDPSLIGSHAQYAKGAAIETTGSIIGNQEWTDSGRQEKEQGLQNIKNASQNRNPETDGWGKTEEIAGRAVGCEGMQQEGAASAQAQSRRA